MAQTTAHSYEIERIKSPALQMTIIILGVFMAILDTSVVNVAIPKMETELNATTDQIQWVMTAYMLVLGVLIPISGWLTDKFGAKKLFLFSRHVHHRIRALRCRVESQFHHCLSNLAGHRRCPDATGRHVHDISDIPSASPRHGDGRFWNRHDGSASFRACAQWVSRGRLVVAIHFLHQCPHWDCRGDSRHPHDARVSARGKREVGYLGAYLHHRWLRKLTVWI